MVGEGACPSSGTRASESKRPCRKPSARRTVDLTHLRTMPDRSGLAFPAGSSEDRLASYLASAGTGSMNIRLDRAVFETGSARLTPESKQQVGNIAAILRTHPNATVAIAGHRQRGQRTSEPRAVASACGNDRLGLRTLVGRGPDTCGSLRRPEAGGGQRDGERTSAEPRVTLDVTR